MNNTNSISKETAVLLAFVIVGILTIFSVPILTSILFVFLVAIIVFIAQKVIEKPPTPETSAPETPAQKTETKFPAALKTVIALIIIGAIIWFVVIPVVIPFVSNLGDSSSKNSQKTANAEKIVTVRVYANGGNCVVSPFFEKGQTIVITAAGSVTGSTDRNHWAYGYVDPTGWTTNPNPQGKKPVRKDIAFMSLCGFFREKRNGGYFSTEDFYIGREISIITERAGTEEICFTLNEIKDGIAYRDAFKNNGGYFTVTIRVI